MSAEPIPVFILLSTLMLAAFPVVFPDIVISPRLSMMAGMASSFPMFDASDLIPSALVCRFSRVQSQFHMPSSLCSSALPANVSPGVCFTDRLFSRTLVSVPSMSADRYIGGVLPVNLLVRQLRSCSVT